MIEGPNENFYKENVVPIKRTEQVIEATSIEKPNHPNGKAFDVISSKVNAPENKIQRLLNIYINLSDSEKPEDMLQCIALAQELQVEANALREAALDKKNVMIIKLGGKLQ